MSGRSAGVVTILFTDIERSTQRWATDRSMPEALEVHDRLIGAAVESNDGTLVKHTGDGVLAVFDRPFDAIGTAVAIQRSMVETGMSVRIGIHTGEVHRRADDLFGLNVSAAARVCDAGHGGQVLVSDATRQVLERPPPGVELVDLGEHVLKDLGAPLRIHQVRSEGLATDFPPLRTLDASDHNLPAQLTSFVGRDHELTEVSGLVQSHRLVTITGVGGVGKTRLALQAAAQTADAFGDGVRLVELAAVSDPDAVAGTVADALGLPADDEGRPIADRIDDWLESREVLLVFDNCEHLIDAVSDMVGGILRRNPGVSALVTSREGLGLPGERIWQIPGLAVADDPGCPAVQLFLDRAEAVDSGLVWNEETGPHIVSVCRRLDGIPLAIELAAARTRALSPAEIGRRLDDRFRLLTGGSRGGLPRQQTLEATIGWSHRLLEHDERLLFERLSVFSGGFALDAAEAVCSGDGVEDVDFLDLLTRLVDKSMVLVVRDPGGVTRYRMLETLRQFGVQRLVESEELPTWRSRHRDHFGSLVAEEGVLGWDFRRGRMRRTLEYGNLDAALDWARATEHEFLPLLAVDLARHAAMTLGDHEHALALLSEAIASPAVPTSVGLRARAYEVNLLGYLGRLDEFESKWSRLEADLESASPDDICWCEFVVGRVFIWAPNLDPARGLELQSAASELSAELSVDAQLEVGIQLVWALAWKATMSPELSRLSEDLIEKATSIGDPRAVADVLSGFLLVVMTADLRAGRTDEMVRVEDRLLALWRGEGGLAEWAVWILIRRGMWDEADAAVAGWDAHGGNVVNKHMSEAYLAWMRGDIDGAAAGLDRVHTNDRHGRWHHDWFPLAAEIAAARGDVEQTRHWLERHRRVPVRPVEELLRLATMGAVVRAEVGAGNAEGAAGMVDEMRAISDHHADTPLLVVQAGSPRFWLAAAEAELTRLTGPDPEAWADADGLAHYAWWERYCRVRRVEACVATGADPGDVDGLRRDLADLGASGLVDLLDAVVSR